MEQLSLAAFWVALASCGIATGLAWAKLVPGWRGVARAGLATATAGSGASGSVPLGPAAPATRGRDLVAIFRMAVLGALAVSLTARGIAAGRPPLADMWEFTVAFAAAVSVFQVAFAARSRLVNADVALQPLVLILLIIAALLPSKVAPLAPSLRSNDILVAHVTVMLAAYGALTVSFGAAALQLWQGSSRRIAGLPPERRFDEIAYRSVVIGFPLLAAGIALGAYWASTAWGRYWGWDPKETSSLVSWLVYGVYFHVHSLRKWAGRRSAVVLVVAYGCILFSYFGVNLWISGLHSYAAR